MKKENSLYLIAIIAVVLLVGVGYAALNARININGSTTVTKATWDVHLENPKRDTSSTTGTTVSFYKDAGHATTWATDAKQGDVYYTAVLPKPGDTLVFTVDVKNGGSIDAVTSGTPTLPTVNATLAKVMSTSCTWSDGSAISSGVTIAAGATKRIKCTTRYKAASELTNDTINIVGSNQTVNTYLSLSFQQA